MIIATSPMMLQNDINDDFRIVIREIGNQFIVCKEVYPINQSYFNSETYFTFMLQEHRSDVLKSAWKEFNKRVLESL